MTHTQIVAVVLDCTRPSGVLYHVLSDTTRTLIKVAGRTYATGHATGNAPAREAGERAIHRALAIAWRRYQHGTDDGADRVAALISPETLARMLAARAQLTE